MACPHTGPSGPAIAGSPDVNINSRPALRVDDTGIHAACCGSNTWTAQSGSPTVFINGKAAHRVGDADRHCGGMGKMLEGSPNVFCDGGMDASTSVIVQTTVDDGTSTIQAPVSAPGAGGSTITVPGSGSGTGSKTGPGGGKTGGGGGGGAKDGGPIYPYPSPFLENHANVPILNGRGWHAGHVAPGITWAQLADMVKNMLVGPDTRGG